MSTKVELQAREADCSCAADFAALAREAAEVDADYAKSLLEQAEGQCQMPLDYIAVAEGAVAVGLAAYATDLFGQAEDACFDALEKGALGASLARTGTDADKGRALLEEAAGEASQLNELLTISGYAKNDLADDDLAASLLAKVEDKAKGLADYVKLAQGLVDGGSAAAARDFYAKAERHLDGMDDTVAFAKGFKDLFSDDAAARKGLEDAETDCQFPKDLSRPVHQAAGCRGRAHRRQGIRPRDH